MTTPGDTSEDNPHTRAAAWIKQWEAVSAFSSATPSRPFTATNWTTRMAPDRPKPARASFALYGWRIFPRGGVRPHEKTFQAIKEERLAPHAGLQREPEPGIRSLPGFRTKRSTTLLLRAGAAPRRFHSRIQPVWLTGSGL